MSIEPGKSWAFFIVLLVAVLSTGLAAFCASDRSASPPMFLEQITWPLQVMSVCVAAIFWMGVLGALND